MMFQKVSEVGSVRNVPAQAGKYLIVRIGLYDFTYVDSTDSIYNAADMITGKMDLIIFEND